METAVNKQDFSKMYYGVAALIVVVVLVLAGVYMKSKNDRPVPMSPVDKLEVLAQLEKSSTSTMTEKEQTKAIEKLSSGTPMKATTDEKMSILGSLQ